MSPIASGRRHGSQPGTLTRRDTKGNRVRRPTGRRMGYRPVTVSDLPRQPSRQMMCHVSDTRVVYDRSSGRPVRPRAPTLSGEHFRESCAQLAITLSGKTKESRTPTRKEAFSRGEFAVATPRIFSPQEMPDTSPQRSASGIDGTSEPGTTGKLAPAQRSSDTPSGAGHRVTVPARTAQTAYAPGEPDDRQLSHSVKWSAVRVTRTDYAVWAAATESKGPSSSRRQIEKVAAAETTTHVPGSRLRPCIASRSDGGTRSLPRDISFPPGVTPLGAPEAPAHQPTTRRRM